MLGRARCLYSSVSIVFANVSFQQQRSLYLRHNHQQHHVPLFKSPLFTICKYYSTANKNYYSILGLQKGATEADIKKAFRLLAKKYHPDLNKDDKSAEIKFKEIVTAYEILSDPQKRRDYDSVGHTTYTNDGGNYEYEYETDEQMEEDIDISQIFQQMGFGGFGGHGKSKGFNNQFEFEFTSNGRNKKQKKKQKKQKVNGSPVKSNIKISFMDSIKGIRIPISFMARANCTPCNGTGSADRESPQPCGTCGGQGVVHIRQRNHIIQHECGSCNGTGEKIRKPCRACSGTGQESKRHTVSVEIPAGINNNDVVRIPRAGNMGFNGGTPGDLLISVTVSKHEFFAREKNDIMIEYPITLSQAVFGSTVEVPTIYGSFHALVKPGTQSGVKTIFHGKGVVATNGTAGSMVIQWKVSIPTGASLTTKQVQLLREYAKDEEKITVNHKMKQ